MIARSFKVIQRVRQSRMAGHSHWQNIQHKKKANDAKKSAAREQLMRPLVSAIARLPRQGGADPETNVPLSLAIKEAVRGGVPKKNVERALQRAADAIQNSRDYNFELRAPNSVLLRLEFFTPNQPRTFSDIMAAIKKLDGVEETKAAFAFDHVGVFVFSSEDVELETVEEVAIDSGAEDVFEVPFPCVCVCPALADKADFLLTGGRRHCGPVCGRRLLPAAASSCRRQFGVAKCRDDLAPTRGAPDVAGDARAARRL
ncbi:MAG: hypothetical protein MHM6MM_007248 [Cercozoa sp. M6MM]